MSHALLGPTAGDSAMEDLFADSVLIKRALDFEAALAKACAAAGLVDPADADLIVRTIGSMALSDQETVKTAHVSGTLAIPVVKAIRNQVAQSSQPAADVVHLGCTSQDLADTILALQCHAAKNLLMMKGYQLGDLLADLAETHANTVTSGRTLIRSALPITFGLRVAQWLTPIAEALARVAQDCQQMPVQLGGAVGTNAGLGGKSADVRTHLASSLDLPDAACSWHTNRTATRNLAAGLILVGEALNKLAHDSILLGLDEVGEIAETNTGDRGGSSAMPSKRNPANAQQCLMATRRLPGLGMSLTSMGDQSLERSVAGWQMELPLLAEMFVWTYDALLHAINLLGNLQINTEVMDRNLNSDAHNLDTGEAVALAHQLIKTYRTTYRA